MSRKLMTARKALLEWNRVPAPPVRLRPSFIKEIRDTLRDDVAKLGLLLGRDLGHWLGATKDQGVTLDKAA
jgi:hypothetical protein